jgi:hypothetical protein
MQYFGNTILGALGRVPFERNDQLRRYRVERPNLVARRGNDALHVAELTVEVVVVGGEWDLCITYSPARAFRLATSAGTVPD